MHARPRKVQPLTLLSVWPWPMRRFGRNASVALRAQSELATAAAAQTVHSSCTTSIVAEQCRLAAREDRGRRQREGAAGGRDGEEPGRLVHQASASLQGTPQRRRWALMARALHRAWCALPAHLLLTAAAPDLYLLRYFLTSSLLAYGARSHMQRDSRAHPTRHGRAHARWFRSGVGVADSAAAAWALFHVFVLCTCFFVRLRFCDWPLQNTPSMARPTPHARRRAVMAISRFAAQECVASVPAMVRRHQPRRAVPHKRTPPVRMCRVPPKASTVLPVSRARARIATPTDLVACEHPDRTQAQRRNSGRQRYRGARVYSGSRCSSP